MTEQEIFENIETLLYTAEYTNKPIGWRFYTRKNVGHLMGDPVTEYYNETVELLRALHQKLNGQEKDFLLNNLQPSHLMLAKQPKTYRLIYEHQDFVFMFYIKTKEIDRALKLVGGRVIITESKVSLFSAINEVLIWEPETFDNIKLKEILSIVENFRFFMKNLENYVVDAHYVSGAARLPAFDTTKIDDYKVSNSYQTNVCKPLLDTIEKRVFQIKKDRLSDSLLQGINFEINQDQAQLQNIISEFGFDKKLNELVLKINEELHNAKDPFDFTGCIGHIRTLLERLCIAIALEIEKKTQIPSTNPPIDRMGKAMDYFRYVKIDFLSAEEKELMGNLFSFISDKGSHALKSEREYARISRNLVIELGLFLVEKLRKRLP